MTSSSLSKRLRLAATSVTYLDDLIAPIAAERSPRPWLEIQSDHHEWDREPKTPATIAATVANGKAPIRIRAMSRHGSRAMHL